MWFLCLSEKTKTDFEQLKAAFQDPKPATKCSEAGKGGVH